MNDIISHTIKQRFIDTNIIKKDDTLILAVSGGRDSMCMLDVFVKLRKNYNYDIVICHINHNIRDKESKRDERFVIDYAHKLSIPCIVKDVFAIDYSKNNNCSLEESARILRYNALNEIRYELLNYNTNNQQKKYYILLAHHKNDQVETIIHNIVRGSSICGLIGMKEITDYYIRPLLNIDRKNIDDYISYFKIPYVDDTTNNNIKYTRNFIRQNIIDDLSKINYQALNHIFDLSLDASNLCDLVYDLSKKQLNKITVDFGVDYYIINAIKYKVINQVIQIEMLKNILEVLHIKKKDISRVHYNNMIDIICGNNNRHLDLPYKLTIDKKNNLVIFKINKNNVSMERRLKK